jgi:O-methyltransferase involved in polyketide biosynthesis
MIEINSNELFQQLLAPLWLHAIEQQYLQPIIRDTKSIEIFAAMDYSPHSLPLPNSAQVLSCIRSAIIDQWVQNYLNYYPDGIVVEIGAGLSTRFERLTNTSGHWFELDSLAALQLRRQFFLESDRRQFIEISITEMDWDWVARVKSASIAPPLFIAEGLLMHLEIKQVQNILSNLANKFYGSMLLFDAAASRWWQNSVKFSWNVTDIYQLHDWDLCYQVLAVKTLRDLSKKYWQRFSLSTKTACILPFWMDSYCITKLGFGYGRTAQRLISNFRD